MRPPQDMNTRKHGPLWGTNFTAYCSGKGRKTDRRQESFSGRNNQGSLLKEEGLG